MDKTVEKRMLEPNTCGNPHPTDYYGEIRVGGWLANYTRGTKEEVEKWLEENNSTEISKKAAKEIGKMIKRWNEK